MEEVINTILSIIENAWNGSGNPLDFHFYRDAMTVLNEFVETEPKKAHDLSKSLRYFVIKAMNESENKDDWFDLYKETLKFDAKDDFDAYLLYLEIDRLPQERFYQPRRKILKQAVDAMQSLVDGELDELFISMPPRVGKTSLLMFFVTWLIGKNSEVSNLYSAYSDFITNAFYNGVLEVLTDPYTYRWNDIFADRISAKNAQLETLDIGRRKRYPSLTCRSLYGTLNGACDCSGFLISDDLIGGIEEALNKDRLVAAWSKVDNNLIPRAKENAKLLWVGTRWSIADPAGVRMMMLEESPEFQDRRYKVINLPALDENDESNFDYDYGVGFSTAFYRQRRASFEHNNDMASWSAQYMGEPIEREGTLFTPDGFRYFNGELPEREPDRKFMAVDPAFGGGDFTASPIGFQYGNEIYIVDVVFSNEDKTKTQPEIAEKASKYRLDALQIEANKMTLPYKEGVEDFLKAKKYRMSITTKPAPPNTSKEQRIFDKAPDIRDMCVFLEPSKRSKEYNLFMQQVFSFKMIGKNKHDDAPDSLAMLMDMVRNPAGAYTVFKKPF